jgi:hypothetical protein
MKRKEYINRYGKKIVFQAMSDTKVLMTGNFGDFYRVSTNPDTGKVSMFDPQGGPFIAVGTTLDHIIDMDRKMITELQIESSQVTIIFGGKNEDA